MLKRQNTSKKMTRKGKMEKPALCRLGRSISPCRVASSLSISTTLRLLAQKKIKLADPDFRPLPFFYSLSLSFQQFGANVFEHKDCALDPNLARQYRVLVFDAHDALEADVHVSFYDILPELRAMAISNRAEDD